MTTQITLPQTQIKPKPTKNQIIEALVERERQIWIEKNKEVEAIESECNKKIHDMAIAMVDISDKDKLSTTNHFGWNPAIVCVRIDVEANDEMVSLYARAVEARRKIGYSFNESDIKHKIKSTMPTQKKINPLLDASYKVMLDSMLEEIKAGQQTHNIEAK